MAGGARPAGRARMRTHGAAVGARSRAPSPHASVRGALRPRAAGAGKGGSCHTPPPEGTPGTPKVWLSPRKSSPMVGSAAPSRVVPAPLLQVPRHPKSMAVLEVGGHPTVPERVPGPAARFVCGGSTVRPVGCMGQGGTCSPSVTHGTPEVSLSLSIPGPQQHSCCVPLEQDV